MRISWVDNAKAIGIFLVVFGHTKGIDPLIRNFIYSFHVPLFFFLSGVLLKDKYLGGTLKSFIMKNIKRLVIPYASFWFISYLYWLPTHSIQGRTHRYEHSSLLEPLWGLLVGTGEALRVNAALWFFTCLFCTAVSFYWIAKVREKKKIMSILILLGLVGPLIHGYIDIRLPWNVELSFVAIVFYGLGYVVSRSGAFRVAGFPKTRFLAVAALFGILLLTVKFNGRVNMNRMQFGNLALFYLGAFSGIGLIMVISHIVPGNIFFEWLSRNSIVVFPLHLLIFSVFTGTGVKVFGLEYSFKEDLIFSVLYTMGVMGVCFPVSHILRRYSPWTIGARNTSPGKLSARTEKSRPRVSLSEKPATIK